MTDLTSSLSGRLRGGRWPAWLRPLLAAGLLALPFLAAWLDGQLERMVSGGYWRPLMMPVVVIAYILLISPLVDRSEARMLRAIRQLVLVDDAEFDRLAHGGNVTADRVGGALAFVAGALAGGLWIGRAWQPMPGDTLWLSRYQSLSIPLLFGVLAMLIYGSIIESNRLSAMMKAPIEYDLFRPDSLESVGRYSLTSSFVFLGGILLGTIFGLDMANLTMWRTWMASVLLGLVVAGIFFSTMNSTHQVMARAQRRELERIRPHLAAARKRFQQRAGDGAPSEREALAFLSLSTYEDRVRNVPTWPYNPRMARVLFASILLPLIVRFISYLIFGG